LLDFTLIFYSACSWIFSTISRMSEHNSLVTSPQSKYPFDNITRTNFPASQFNLTRKFEAEIFQVIDIGLEFRIANSDQCRRWVENRRKIEKVSKLIASIFFIPTQERMHIMSVLCAWAHAIPVSCALFQLYFASETLLTRNGP
jgi:hypothetical protein